MDKRIQLLILRAGLLLGLGAGLCIGMGVMMLANAVVLPRWLNAVQSNVYLIALPSLLCFVGGIQLLKKSRQAAHD